VIAEAILCQKACCLSSNKHGCAQDDETDVAAAAATALGCLAVPTSRLEPWLQPVSMGGQLTAALGHEDATVRSRALSLTVALAGSSPEAAEMVLRSGTTSR
jgi:hypothetical protein